MSVSITYAPERGGVALEDVAKAEHGRLVAALYASDLLPARLHIAVEQAGRPGTGLFVHARLAIPDHFLVAEAVGHDPAAALRKALFRLLKQLDRLRLRLSGEPAWKQKWRRHRAELRASGVAPTELKVLWREQGADLHRFGETLVAGEPTGERRDPDERLAQIMAAAEGSLAETCADLPPRISLRAGFYRAVREAARMSQTAAAEANGSVAAVTGDGRNESLSGPALPIPMCGDPHRDVYTLHFREGFEDYEVAWILDASLQDVRRAIADINQQIRAMIAHGAMPVARAPS